jgi:hypothetical protein
MWVWSFPFKHLYAAHNSFPECLLIIALVSIKLSKLCIKFDAFAVPLSDSLQNSIRSDTQLHAILQQCTDGITSPTNFGQQQHNSQAGQIEKNTHIH